MRKVIWLINQYSYPPDYTSHTRHNELFKYLSEKFEIYIFCSNFSHHYRKYIKKGFNIIKENNLNFVLIPTIAYKKNNLFRIINIFQFFFGVFYYSRKIKSPDLIISSSPHPLSLINGFYFLKKFKKPFISEIRDLWPQSLIDLKYISYKSIIAKVLRYIELITLKNSKYVITLLPYVNEYFQEFKNIDKNLINKIIWIPNGVNLEEFDRYKDIYRNYIYDEIKKLKENNFIVMYTGNLGPANSPFTIAETAKLLKDEKNIKFVIIGDGVLKDKLIKFKNENDLNNVIFFKKINYKYIPSILELGDLFLLPILNIDLYKYGISIVKLYTYMAAAKPIIISCNIRNNEVLNANCGLSFEPENAEELKEKILKIYTMDPAKRNLLGKNCRKYCEENFDFKILAKKLFELVDNAINKVK